MAQESVIFLVRGQDVFREYEHKRLRVGAVIYVCFDPEEKATTFSSTPIEGAEQFIVQWITDHENGTWGIRLLPVFAVPGRVYKDLEDLVGEFIDPAVIESSLRHIGGQVRAAHYYKSSELRHSPVAVIGTCIDRLTLCRKLTNLERRRELFPHGDALVIHLLLTCFDRLGQHADYLHFRDWLQATKAPAGRNQALSHLADGATPLAVAQHLHDAYQQEYGVRQAFNHFLDHILPLGDRDRLLESLRIETVLYPPARREPTYADTGQKYRYLYEMRNQYTHEARYQPSALIQLATGATESQWTEYAAETREAEMKTIYVRDWPAALERAVRRGLARYLELHLPDSAPL